MLYLIAKRIQTASAIDKENHRERQCVLAEVSNLLLHAVFCESEVFLLQSADDPSCFLLQDLSVEGDSGHPKAGVAGWFSRSRLNPVRCCASILDAFTSRSGDVGISF